MVALLALSGCELYRTIAVPSNGLASTPPIGWNSWNYFGGNIDDPTVRAIADAMVSSGMRDAGYAYVNLDDTWQGQRDSAGNLQANSRFPDMQDLINYVHHDGLKFGIYSSPGPITCAGYVGSYGHEQQDANTFAAWGVDYLKYDWCGASEVYSPQDYLPVYQKMASALQATGRPIIYSLSNGGDDGVEIWGAWSGANLWRTSRDIKDSWQSMMDNIQAQEWAARYAGPGHWNDPDMLEIGNGGMSIDEYRTQMSLWALASAPLLAGNDLRNMSPETASILINDEVIAIDQDPRGTQASLSTKGNIETWTKPLSGGDVAVGFVNTGSAPTTVEVNIQKLGFSSGSVIVRDLWAHQNLSPVAGSYEATVPSHGILMLKLTAH